MKYNASHGSAQLSLLAATLAAATEGKHIGTIKVPERVSNVAWGDQDGKALYITASTSLYRIKLKIAGARN